MFVFSLKIDVIVLEICRIGKMMQISMDNQPIIVNFQKKNEMKSGESIELLSDINNKLWGKSEQ